MLDLSESALAVAKVRLGEKEEHVQWVAADVTTWEPTQTYDLWHDRAAFRFPADHADRSAYMERLKKALRPGSHVIIGTFALNGAERCSGLPSRRPAMSSPRLGVSLSASSSARSAAVVYNSRIVTLRGIQYVEQGAAGAD